MDSFFAGQGFRIDGMIHLSPREAKAATDRGALLVDLRPEYAVRMKTFALPDVLCLEQRELMLAPERVPSDRPLILADSVGVESKRAVALLLERGHANVANLIGGMVEWEGDGMPTQVDPGELWVGECACKLRPRKDYWKVARQSDEPEPKP